MSGILRDSYIRKGYKAISCDLLPSESSFGPHIQGDVLKVIKNHKFDLMVAFPPCDHLATSGSRWFKEKIADGRQQQSIDFFMALVNAPINKIAIENPKCIMSTRYRKPDQTIQPYQFGHPERKLTCLWLKNLPKLTPTNLVEGREPRIHWMGESSTRKRNRSLTYTGIAEAMSSTWIP